MASQEPVSPKLATPAPTLTPEELKQKALKALDADAWAEEIRLRRGMEGIRAMETRLAFYGEHPGWTRRWCNDDGDNIPRRLADGWRFVQKNEVQMSESVGFGNADVGDRVTIISNVGGGPMPVHLMEIPTQIAEELLDARSYSQVRRWDESIRRGEVGGVTSKNTYPPGERPGSMHYGIHNEVKRPQ